MPVGAVGGVEARTAVLSGHQLARPFALGARGARFAGGMLDEGSEGKSERKRGRCPAFWRQDNSLGSWAEAADFEALLYLGSYRFGDICTVVESKPAKTAPPSRHADLGCGFVKCKLWPNLIHASPKAGD